MRKHVPIILILSAIAMAPVYVGCHRTALKPQDRVTKANFDKIKIGMSEDEVGAILGGESKVRMPGTDTRGLPAKFVILNDVETHAIWEFRPDPSTDTKKIEIGFKDGKVVVKTQTGL